MHDQRYSSLRFQNHRDIGSIDEEGAGASRQESSHGEVLLPLVLPHVPNHKRVIYTIYEYDPLLDSSNMTMDDWIQISKVRNCHTHFV